MMPDELNSTIGDEAEIVEQRAEHGQGSPSSLEDDPAKTRYENLLRREPYHRARCTVTLTLQFLPEDGDPAGRPVLIGVQDHAFAPTIRMTRLAELALPPLVTQLLDEHLERIGEREQAHQKEVEARRQAATQRVRQPTRANKKVKLADLPAPTPPAASTVVAIPKDKPQQSALF